MASTDISINQLPETGQVNNGDFIIIQTPNATNRLDFANFVVGLDQTTFGNTIEKHTTDIEALQSRGYQSYEQTVFKTQVSRPGDTDGTTDLGLETNIKLNDLSSKLKISFSIPGVITGNEHTAALVLQYSSNGSTWQDIPDFLGAANGSAMRGTVLIGSDGDTGGTVSEGNTSSFTGIYQPTVLGTGNVIYIRVGLRLQSGVNFSQNKSNNDSATDGTAVSLLLLEELFTSN